MLEIFFMLVLAGALILRYSPVLGLEKVIGIDTTPLRVDKENPKYQMVKDEKILVLGNNLNYYQHNSLGSPYLDWDLARQHFKDLNNYLAVFRINRHFSGEQPAYIIDQRNLMPALQHTIPVVFEQYQPLAGQKGVYKRTD